MNEKPTNGNCHESEVIDSRKPLWRTTLKVMRDEGIEFGKFYSTQWLEENMAVQAGTIQFVAGVCSINREIKSTGFILRSRGNKGTGYNVVRAENAEDVVQGWQANVRSRLVDCIVYSSGVLQNDKANLDEEQRARLMKLEEKSAMRLALHERTMTIHKYVKAHAPKLLDNGK